MRRDGAQLDTQGVLAAGRLKVAQGTAVAAAAIVVLQTKQGIGKVGWEIVHFHVVRNMDTGTPGWRSVKLAFHLARLLMFPNAPAPQPVVHCCSLSQSDRLPKGTPSWGRVQSMTRGKSNYGMYAMGRRAGQAAPDQATMCAGLSRACHLTETAEALVET